MQKIINHAASAAKAHGIHSNVTAGEEWDGEKFTGKFFVSVELSQAVYTAPENDSSVSRIQSRRIIGNSIVTDVLARVER